MIDFNFISYVFGKKRKKKLSIIVLMSNSSYLKIVQNLLGALYTLVHLAHFPCTVSVIPLYNDTNFIFLIFM